MKKLYLFIFIVAMLMGKSLLNAQVLGYPGATWVFTSTGIWAVCFQVNEQWEYVQDSTILGVGVKDIKLTRKTLYPPPFPSVITSFQHHYFHVNGDTAWLFVPSDSTWQMVYNFSLQTGDSTANPLSHRLNMFANSCPDSVPYNEMSAVVDHGTTTIDGQSLRYYTIKYHTGSDTSTAYQTYYERLITLNYWHPNDIYWCGAVVECSSPSLVCYKDNGMMTDSTCSDLSWFETLSTEDELHGFFRLYPNPVNEFLWVESNLNETIFFDILSIDGKCVVHHVQSPINLNLLPPGIYMLSNQQRTIFEKFIKN